MLNMSVYKVMLTQGSKTLCWYVINVNRVCDIQEFDSVPTGLSVCFVLISEQTEIMITEIYCSKKRMWKQYYRWLRAKSDSFDLQNTQCQERCFIICYRHCVCKDAPFHITRSLSCRSKQLVTPEGGD
jgi:hypothetical protein